MMVYPNLSFGLQLLLILLAQGLYTTYLPLPLALLTEKDNSQHVYISPEAFKVASREFKDEIEFWQQALPGHLKGQLASVLLLHNLSRCHHADALLLDSFLAQESY